MKTFSSFLTQKGRWLLATLTLLFSLSIGQMWADAIVWQSDLQSSIEGVSVTKLNNSDTWATDLSLAWASGFTKAYQPSGSGRGVQLAFNTSLNLLKNDVIRVYVGGANNTERSIKLYINEESSEVKSVVAPNGSIRVLDYELPSNAELNKIKITSDGNGVYLFRVVIYRDRPTTGEATITYEMRYKYPDVQGRTDNLITTLSGFSTQISLTGLSTSTSNNALNFSGEMTGMPTGNSMDDSKYADLQFTIADGYTFTPTSCSFKWGGKSTDLRAKVAIIDGGSTPTILSNESAITNSTPTLANASTFTFASGAFDGVKLSGTVHIRIYPYKANSRAYLATPFSITGTVAAACQNVSAPTGLTCSAKTSSALTFTWSTATNASSYDVKLWDNDGCAGDPVATGTVTDASKTFSGLNPSTTYYCKVQSKGDGSTYCAEGGVTDAASGTTEAASGYAITKSETNGTIATTVGGEIVSFANASAKVDIEATPNTGYGFTSWDVYKTGEPTTKVALNDDDDSDNKTRSFNMPAYAVTVGATFTAINYNITHSAATNGTYTIQVGESAATDENTKANYGQTITLAATPASSAYYHAGWTVTGDVSGDNIEVTENAFTMPDEAVTIAATFAENKTITYNANNGTGTMAPTVDHGVIHLRANTYTKDGYVFAGWATSQANANLGTIAYADGAEYNLTDNAELFAVWYTVLYSFTAKDVASSTAMEVGDEVDASTGGTMTVLTTPASYETYGVLLGYDNPNKGSYQVTMSQNMSAGAKIIGLLYMTGDSNNRGVNVVNSAGTQKAQWKFTADGNSHKFTYDVIAGDGFAGNNVIKFTRINTVAIQSIIVAQFVAPSIDYTVTIDPNGGAYASTPEGWTYNEGVYTKTIANATSFSAPEGLAKEGYVLTGWKDGGDNDITFPQMISGNITFVAQWAPTYTATLSPAGGSTDAEGWTYNEGVYTKSGLLATTEVTLPTMTKDGYNFVKWTADQNVTINAATVEAGEDIAEGTVVKLSANTTFTASWTEIPKSTDATLSDLTVGGETVDGFDPDDIEYDVVLPIGTTVVPTVAGTANDTKAKSVVVTAATSLPGSTTVVVTAEDNSTTKTYTINFSVATSKDIVLVYKTNETTCAGTASAVAQASSFSTYLTLDAGTESSTSVNTTNATNGRITISAKAGYAFKAMSFYGKVQDGSCGVSLDGAAATTLELDPQSTTDACYENVFSNAEVRTFSIINTGTNGVWIRNMKLTVIQACTPISLAWDEEPVEFEVGKSGQTIAATANNSGTVTYSSTNGDVIEVAASTGALTVKTLGSVTLSASTPEGDGTTYCANGGEAIEISKSSVKAYYLVTYDAQNETAETTAKYYGSDALVLPTPVYAGHELQGWYDAATLGNKIGDAGDDYLPTASIKLYAQWAAECTGPTITTQPQSANYFVGRTAAALTCEATAGEAGELTYTWYSCDDAEMNNPVALAGAPTPSTAAVGTYYYFCTVTEAGCGVIRTSNVATITVTEKDKLCLIKVVTTGSTNKTVSGYCAGDAEVSLQSDKKFGSNAYMGFWLDDEYSFQENDVLNVHIIGANTSENGTISLYSAKQDQSSLIYDFETAGVVGDNRLPMPAAVNAYDKLYICRTSENAWNAYVDSITVYRAYPTPELTAISLAGIAAAKGEGATYSATLPKGTILSTMVVAPTFMSNDPENTNGAVVGSWEWGENTYRVTDKDGDHSDYTITLTEDVAIESVTISGETTVAAKSQITLTATVLPAGAANKNVTWTTSDASKATVDEYGVVTGKAAGNVTITATSVADGTIKDTYAITVTPFVGTEYAYWFVKAADATPYGITNDDGTIFESAPTDGSNLSASLTMEINGVETTYNVTRRSGDSDFGTFHVPADFTANLYMLVIGSGSPRTLTLKETSTNTEYASIPATFGDQATQILFENIPSGNYSFDKHSQSIRVALMVAELNSYPLTSVSVESGFNLRIGTSRTPTLTLNPTKAAIASQTWSVVSQTGASDASLNTSTGVITAGTEEGVMTVKVTVTDVFGNEVESGNCAVSIVNIIDQQPVTGSVTWNWNGAAAANVAVDQDVSLVLANYGLAGENWDKLKGTHADFAYNTNNDGCYQGSGTLSFTTTVNGLVTIRARRISNNADIKLGSEVVGQLTNSAQTFGPFAVKAGEVNIVAEATKGMRILSLEFNADMQPGNAQASGFGGFNRDVTEGRLGTICLPKAGVMVGASIYEVAYYGATSQKIFFDEVLNGEMEAGMPYIFLPDEGATQLGVFYTGTAAEPDAKHKNGLYGSYTQEELSTDGSCYILLNNQYCQVVEANTYVGDNRAYIKLGDITPSEPALAPGRRRIAMGVQGKNTATGMDEITNDQSQMTNKVIIDGHLFILRGEKMYDATGRLVK